MKASHWPIKRFIFSTLTAWQDKLLLAHPEHLLPALSQGCGTQMHQDEHALVLSETLSKCRERPLSARAPAKAAVLRH